MFIESRLNQNQLDKMSDIASDLALISVASVGLPAVFDKYDPVKITAGIFAAIVFWTLSLWLRR
ncbi:MAG: hypothetical protein AAB414_00325 [Patescibacteria group bacterium]